MDDNEKLLEKLKKEHPIKQMITFSELDITEKLTQNDFLIIKYRDLYHQELAKLDKLEDLLNKLIGLRYKYYRFEDNQEWTKQEIEKFAIPSDPKIIQMKKIIRRQEVKLRFFEMAWKAFDKRQWSMKMFMETLKGY